MMEIEDMMHRYHIPVRDFVEPAITLFFIAAVVTLSNWRHWLRPLDAKMADGTPDPRAGKILRGKVISDFLGIPTIVILGCVFLGLGYSNAFCVALVVFLALIGSAGVSGLALIARDELVKRFTNLLPGKPKE